MYGCFCCSQVLNSVLHQKGRVPELVLSISQLEAIPKLPLAADLSLVEISKHKLLSVVSSTWNLYLIYFVKWMISSFRWALGITLRLQGL